MNRTNLSLTVILFLCLQLPECSKRTPGHEMQAQVAMALSEQFETVIYSNTNLIVNESSYKGGAGDDLHVFRNAFIYLQAALDSLSLPATDDALTNSDSIIVGAKNFRPPARFGTELSQRCYVVILKDRHSFNLSRHTTNNTPVSTEGEIRAWKWVAQVDGFEDGPSELYATQIGNSFLLVANDLQELQQVARRLQNLSTSEVTIKSGTSEWQKLLPYEMWGYRSYHKNTSTSHPSGGLIDVPKNAKSLTFFLDTQSKKLVLNLTVDEPIDESTIAKMYSSNRLPSPQLISANMWELVIPLSGNAESFRQMASIITLYGFAIFA